MLRTYKIKHINIPKNGAKPLEALVQNSIPAGTFEFQNQSEITNFLLSKHKEGFKYLGKEELDDGTFLLYFGREV